MKEDHMPGIIATMIGAVVAGWLAGWEGLWLNVAAAMEFCLYWVTHFVSGK